MKVLILLFVFVTISFSGKSQTPAHFFLGQEELAGVHIYDLHQDQNLNYWIGTNNGLYRFDGYDFERFDSPEMLSPSLFNVISDSKGNIYCHNLGGQVFKVAHETCKLYYKIPDSLLTPLIKLTINTKDELVVLADGVFSIEPESPPKMLLDNTLRNGEFISLPLTETKIVGIIDGGFHRIEMTNKDTLIEPLYWPNAPKSPYLYPVIQKDSNLLIYERSEAQLKSIINDTIVDFSALSSEQHHFGIFRSEDYFWAPYPTSGILIFPDISAPDNKQKFLFKDYKISAFYEDHEGNVLLGTFDHGIIVIPKTDITDINLDQIEGRLSQICETNRSGITYATTEGQIGLLNEDGTTRLIFKNIHGPVELLEYLPEEDAYLIGSNESHLVYNDRREKRLLFGNIKDLSVLSDRHYLLALNVGATVFSTNNFLKNPITEELEDTGKNDHLKLYSGRSYAINFDTLHKTLYLGTSVGLKVIDSSGTNELKLEGKDILCRDLLFLDGKMYVATNNKGVLVYEDKVLVDHWTAEKQLQSNFVELIISDGRQILVTTGTGIQILTKTGQPLRLISQSDGLYADHVIDLELQNNLLWVLHQKGLQQVNLAKIKTDAFQPKMVLEKVTVSGKTVSPLKKGIFDYNQNKIGFNFSSKSLKYRDEIYYAYRLKGIETDWQEKPYPDHHIEYKTLPAGDYEFQVKAIYRSVESPIVSYSFSISTPFWKEWWFYATILALLILLLYLYFLSQIRKQRRKAKLQEELNQSKLTAIQAQMNPHFIFNALNSIQDLVLKNDAENAYVYISKFALLVRNTLNHSDKDFIEFSEELTSIELYLGLEKLRFKDHFDFSVEATVEDDIQIPPMLVQPFIENSLVHGLLHKEGHKKLKVKFERQESLVCTITDNGIGRREAKRIQKRQNENHESFALKAIKKRLEILELRYGGKFEVRYIDLYENEVATGTKVILSIPYLMRY